MSSIWHSELCSEAQNRAVAQLEQWAGKVACDDLESPGEEHAPACAETTQDEVELRSADPEVFVRLRQALRTCTNLSQQLDAFMGKLDSIAHSYETVSSRTTALVHNCEDMLYRQTALQQLAERVQTYLEPFTEMEELAKALGVPFGYQLQRAPAQTQLTTSRSNMSLTELADAFSRIDKIGTFLASHSELQRNPLYGQWLERLQQRAASLVVMSVKKSVDTAFREAQGGYHNLDGPLESALVYSRFRAIAPRLKKLCGILYTGNVYIHQGSIGAVLEHYISKRAALLAPFVNAFLPSNDVAAQSIAETNTTPRSRSQSDASEAEHQSLPAAVRKLYSSLQRMILQEMLLFQSIFSSTSGDDVLNPKSRNANGTPHSAGGTNDIDVITHELAELLELLCAQAREGLRPKIIRQSHLEELCRSIVILHEDIKLQFEALKVGPDIRRRLQMAIEATASDCQERLLYLADVKIRAEVEFFEARPSDLAYPELLSESDSVDDSEQMDTVRAHRRQNSSGSAFSNDSSSMIASVGSNWYQPLRNTLSILSKLYNVLEIEVFEDIAGRCVAACVQSLIHGAAGVKKRSSALHGNLFLVRHTLLLREQLLPFNIRFTTVERVLSFSTTGLALTRFVSNPSHLLRFNAHNALLQLAQEGLPRLEETRVDGKKRMDDAVRDACGQLAAYVVEDLAGPLRRMCVDVRELLRVPNEATHDELRLALGSLSDDGLKNLARQPAVRPERVRNALRGVVDSVAAGIPEFVKALRLYVSNAVTRSVLLRPIQGQMEETVKDGVCIVQYLSMRSATPDDSRTRSAYDEVETMLGVVLDTIQKKLQP